MNKALAKVKEDGPDPTPGYIFDQLAQATFEGQKEMMKLAEALIKNLNSTSVYVLQKSLKAIRMTCEKGHPSFKKEMQGQVERLRTVAAFRGKSDPVHGDSQNQKVREAAQGAIEAAFAATKTLNTAQSGDYKGQSGGSSSPLAPPQTFTTGNSISQSSIASSGFGSQPGAGAAGPAKTGVLGELRSAMSSGFGLAEPSETEKIMQRLQAEQQGSNSSYVPPTSIAAPSFQPPTLGELAPQSNKWGKDTGFKAPEAVDAQVEEQLSAEQQLVDSFIKANKASTPSRTQLSNFIQAAQALNLSEICEALDDHLEAKQAWQIRLSAMCAVELLVQSNLQAARVYFTQHPEDVVRNVSVVQASLKEKATKVLTLLGLQDMAEKSPRAQQKMDIFNQMQAATGSTTSASPTAGGGAGMFDMAGMTVKEKPASPAVGAFGGPASPTGVGAAAKATSKEDKGLRTRKSRAPAAAPAADFSLVGGAPAPAPQVSNGSFGGDFFGTTAASPVAAASPPAAAPAAASPVAASPTVSKPSVDLDDLFGSPSPAAPVAPVAAPVAPAGSPFPFLNTPAPAAAADPLASLMANPTPAPQAAVPMMNMGQMTPQQMQAQMAQMMMMMQSMGMQPGMMGMPGMMQPGAAQPGQPGMMWNFAQQGQPQPNAAASTTAFDFLAQEVNVAMKK